MTYATCACQPNPTATPERTGWTQLQRIVVANKNANPPTILITGVLDVKIIESLSGKTITIDQKKIPNAKVFNNATFMANIARLPFPAPSTFATRTPVAAKSPNGIMDSHPMTVIQESESNGDEEGCGNGNGGKVTVTQVSGKGLTADSERKHGQSIENGGPCYFPYFV